MTHYRGDKTDIEIHDRIFALRVAVRHRGDRRER